MRRKATCTTRGLFHCCSAALLGAAVLLGNTAMADAACDTHGVRSQLEKLYQRDVDFRRGKGPNMDADNIAHLKQIVARCGWPLRSRYGERTSQAAFVVVQHAGLEDQLQLLRLLEQAESDGEWPKGSLPLLHDRIRVRQGLPQVYGTQFQGVCVPFLVDDPDGLESRRQAAGLIPYADYLAICRDQAVGGFSPAQ